MTAVQNIQPVSGFLLRVSVARFGRIDPYFVDSEESSNDFLCTKKHPTYSTLFNSFEKAKQLANQHTNKRCEFDILYYFYCEDCTHVH